ARLSCSSPVGDRRSPCPAAGDLEAVSPEPATGTMVSPVGPVRREVTSHKVGGSSVADVQMKCCSQGGSWSTDKQRCQSLSVGGGGVVCVRAVMGRTAPSVSHWLTYFITPNFRIRATPPAVSVAARDRRISRSP